MSCLLSVQNIEASYGRAQALFGVSFEVEQGEVVTLLGRNGMGRSTAIKCLFGLLPVTKGAITFQGQPVHALPSYSIARLGLGLVPEGRQVFPNLSVEENLVATARAPVDAGAKPWTLKRIYQFFPKLEERRANFGSQLSGGEQQMLAIGRALMTNPRLLVLDEATEGLAPIVRTEIWHALTALKQEGVSQIVVDKNVGALTTFSDRHYVLEKGRVVWSGTNTDLQQSPHIIQQYMGV